MMKSFRIRFVSLAACTMASLPAAADTTVFVNVNVIPMTAEIVLTEQTVVVQSDKIIRIGHVDTVPVPRGAQVVDGTDRFLMPGLAEMHAHITTTDASQVERLVTLFVANGVTTIRGMLGRIEHLALRDRFASGEVFGPRFTTSGPSLNGRSVAGPSDAARQVIEQQAAGYDFIKVHPGLDSDEFASLARTANNIGIPVAGHVPAAAGVWTALQLKMTTIEHLDGYFAALLPASSDGLGGYGGFFGVMLAKEVNVDRIPAIAAATAEAGTWNVPTQVLIEQLIDETPVAELKRRAEMRYVSASELKSWVAAKREQLNERGFDRETAKLAIELRRRIIIELHRSGAGLLLGSDAPQVFNVPGFSIHRELDALVAAGLTPYEALRTGTAAVADFLKSNTGTVVENKQADLILLDANPLLDIRNTKRIHGVMLRGRWLSRGDLDALLARYVVQDGK